MRFFLAIVITMCALSIQAAEVDEIVDELLEGRGSPASYKAVMKEPSKALPRLISALEDPIADKRARSLRLLSRIRLPEARKAILRAMKEDSVWMNRHEAIWGTRNMVTVEAAAALEEAIKNDASGMNRVAAIRLLSHQLRGKSVSKLKPSLSDSDVIVKLAAARELGRYGDKSGLTVTEANLDHADARTRAMAYDALGMVGDNKHLPKLSKAAKDDSEQQVRIKADQSALSIEARSLKGKQRVDFVKNALADTSWAKRTWATADLADSGDANSVKILKEAAADPKHPAREECSQALARLEADDGGAR